MKKFIPVMLIGALAATSAALAYNKPQAYVSPAFYTYNGGQQYNHSKTSAASSNYNSLYNKTSCNVEEGRNRC